MKRARFERMLFVVAITALVGALAGIAGSAAAPSKKSSSSAAKKKAQAQRRAARRAPGHGPGFGPGGPAVRSQMVVPNADGTGFDTVTMDSGTVLSVDGTTVHLKEGTSKATYKDDLDIDVGGDAKVYRNGAAAKLGDLQKDDRVRVVQGPQGNFVEAADAAWLAQSRKDHGGGGPGRWGPGAHPPGSDSDQKGSSSDSDQDSDSGTSNS